MARAAVLLVLAARCVLMARWARLAWLAGLGIAMVDIPDEIQCIQELFAVSF